MTTLNRRTDRITADQKMIVGTQKHVASLPSLPVGSQTLAPTDIVKVYQDRVTAAQASETAHAAFTAAVKADRDKRAQTASLTAAYKRIVLGMFAESPDTLADFGLVPLKKGTRTVATKAGAIAKNKATREARHTMGSKQKAAIHGTVPPTDPGNPDPPATIPSQPTPPPAAPPAPPAAPPAKGAA